jgi:hypothetical protein
MHVGGLPQPLTPLGLVIKIGPAANHTSQTILANNNVEEIHGGGSN